MIIYIHGFNSTGPDSGKFAELTNGLPDIDVHAPTYSSADPDEATQKLEQYIESYKGQYEDLMLIGTSLGGYYAQYLGHKYGAKIVLINPALEPTKTLKQYLGENTNFYTGEKYFLTEDNITKLEKYDVASIYHDFGSLVLLDKGDDVIDYKVALTKYNDCVTYEGGSHRFDHMKQALPLIREYYYSMWA